MKAELSLFISADISAFKNSDYNSEYYRWIYVYYSSKNTDGSSFHYVTYRGGAWRKMSFMLFFCFLFFPAPAAWGGSWTRAWTHTTAVNKPLQWQQQIFNLLSHTGDPCCCFFVLFHFVFLSLVSVNYYQAYYLIFAFKNFSAHISLLNMFIRTGKRALKIAILHLRKLRLTIEKWFDKSL